jgi:serine/threonine-protein kinase
MDADSALVSGPIGRYQPLRLLGRGAMGRVLLALDPVVGRNVAIKLLRDDLVIPPEQRDALIDRMRQEARASARVSHPKIVVLYDMGEYPELGLYLVFEFAEGLTLEERIARGPLGPEGGA